MKKLIAAAAALLISVSSFAQFGIVGGLTSSATDIKSAVSDFQSKTINQYHVGITYKLALGNILAIQPSLVYNVKGAAMESVTGISDINFKTGFIELPVQIQAGIGLGSLARVYGIAEPFIGYAITNEVTMSDIKNTDWDNVKNRFECGIGLGAGVELFSHLQVSVRYFWNLGSVYGSDISIGSVTKTISESKCNGISLSAAFLF